MQQHGDRRGGSGVVLRVPVTASIVFTVGDQEVEIDGEVVRASARTMVVELASGARTLALAASPTCEVAIEIGGVTIRTSARPGRRVGDVPDPLQLELVVEEGMDLERLLS